MQPQETPVREAEMLEEIRKLLRLSIEDFVYQMDWPNTKYYDYIKNGRKRTGSVERKYAHPTIHKIFTGINHAISVYPHWQKNRSEITAIIVAYLLPSV